MSYIGYMFLHSNDHQEYALHLESSNVPTLITNNVRRPSCLGRDFFCGLIRLKAETFEQRSKPC